MKLVWSLPVRGATDASTRGDLVRARALITALEQEGHEVVLLEADANSGARTAIATYRGAVRRALPRAGALLLRDAGRVVHGLDHGRRLATLARRERAAAIIETQVHFAASGGLAARMTGLPLILDDASPSMEEHLLGAALPGVARSLLLRQSRLARAVCVSSSGIRALLVEEGVPPEKLHIVPNGVDITLHDQASRGSSRRTLGLPEDRVVLVFVGSFQPWHAAGLLVEALHRVPDAPLHLLLVGDGPGRTATLAEAAARGIGDRVTAPGPLRGPELAEALAVSDIGVLPGSNEYGQPMKLLDYAAARLAIVAPDLAPVREVVKADHTALLIPPGDPDALATTLARLAADPELRSRLGLEARRTVAAHASWRTRALGLLSLLSTRTGPRVTTVAPSLERHP
jgi:glycosyltransferase involved in cell wall biosynthesis